MAARYNTGRIKWFSWYRGFGYIQSDDGLEVFVHISALRSPLDVVLEKGERVTFKLVQGARCLEAAEVGSLRSG